MSNELRRRLEVLSEHISEKEVISVIDKYIQQLTNSGYSWRQQREIIVSALKGHVRRENERKLKKESKYRSGQKSLRTRMEKKLTERYNWFRRRKKIGESNEREMKEKRTENENRDRKRHSKIMKNVENGLEKEKTDELLEDYPKAVLFVPSTPNSELAKCIRNVIVSLKPWTGISVKVVDRAGEKLEEILHKSNPWENADCKRDICKPCESESKNGEPRFKNCTRRSVVYKTWCNLCIKKKNEENKSEIGEKSDKKRKREGTEIENVYTYIGETSRSAWERGEEHWKDLQFRRPKSHMMRHLVEFHPEISPNEADFRMRIVSTHNSAFERQIKEAVLIERNDGPFSMNSKLEYSRTVIPKIKTKMGEHAEEDSPSVKREKEIVEKIKIIQSDFNSKKKKNESENQGCQNEITKRRKMDEKSDKNENTVNGKVTKDKSSMSFLSGGPHNITKLDCPNMSNIDTNRSNIQVLSGGPINIATLDCPKVSNIDHIRSNISFLPGGPNNIATLDCPNMSNATQDGPHQMSETNNIATLSCSNMSDIHNQKIGLSTIATLGCSNVSKYPRNMSNMSLNMSNQTSGLSNKAKLDRSKVSKISHNEKSDKSNINQISENTDQISENMTKKILIFERNTVKKSFKIDPLKVNKLKSPSKVLLKGRPKSVKSSPNINTFSSSRRPSKLDLNLSKNIQNYDNPGLISNRIESCKSPENLEARGKSISSSSQDRCHQVPIQNSDKSNKKSSEIQGNKRRKSNPNVGSNSGKKLAKKVGHKQPKISGFLSKKVEINSTKEKFERIAISQNEKVKTSSVNSEENSGISAAYSEKSAENVSILNVMGNSQDLKKVSKISKIIDAFESNFVQTRSPVSSKSDFESTVDVKTALKNNVGGKKDAFDLLMSGGVKTPRKSKLKRIIRGKGNSEK